MDVREKLVELLEPHVSGLACEYESGSCELTSCRSCNARNLADHLISNGVTVQEWIPVTERLPDLIPCNVGTAYSEAVIAWTSGRKAMIAVWDGIDWIAPFDYWEAWGEEITHWMPLPEPPKGERLCQRM